MTDHIIYMDNAATTATRPEVLEAMLPYFTEHYGNPSSIHSVGRDARRAVEKARAQVAAALGAQAGEIYFTGSGTESDNWAIRCASRALAAKGKHIITSQIEHHAVLHACQYMEKQGYEVTYLPVDENGLVSVEDVKNAIRIRSSSPSWPPTTKSAPSSPSARSAKSPMKQVCCSTPTRCRPWAPCPST